MTVSNNGGQRAAYLVDDRARRRREPSDDDAHGLNLVRVLCGLFVGDLHHRAQHDVHSLARSFEDVHEGVLGASRIIVPGAVADARAALPSVVDPAPALALARGGVAVARSTHAVMFAPEGGAKIFAARSSMTPALSMRLAISAIAGPRILNEGGKGTRWSEGKQGICAMSAVR